jgi:hypothetical protein
MAHLQQESDTCPSKKCCLSFQIDASSWYQNLHELKVQSFVKVSPMVSKNGLLFGPNKDHIEKKNEQKHGLKMVR